MYKTLNRLYEFGPFTLDPAERQLRQGDRHIELPPRAFDTLLVMVSNSGRLLEKDALMRSVWGDTVVEESNLSQIVYLLRKALHEGDHGSRYIETVPKRGYRFVAPVHEIQADGESDVKTAARPSNSSTSGGASSGSPAEDRVTPIAIVHSHPADAFAKLNPPLPKTSPAIPKKLLLGPSFVLLSVILVAATVWKARLRNDDVLPPIRSIAVLPLQNLSNDPNQEYFVDGMTDELITDLAQIRGLKVVSKTSVMQYKGARLPLPQIGRDLKVDAVVEGSVMRSGDHVRITSQLIRAATDRHMWAASYEGDLKDVLSLQARVAAAITNEVKLNLTAEENGRLRAGNSTDPEAFDLYLRGRYAWNQRNVESFNKAVDFFNQAIKRDPNFALAYSGLADSWALLVLYGDNPAHLGQAKDAAERALGIDPNLAEAHTSLGAVLILRDWDWQGAEREFQRAIELNPNYAQAHHWYGNLLLSPQGRHNEAISELLRAQDLDPLCLIISADLGFAHYLAGENDLALQTYQKVLAMNPNFVPAHFYLSQYYKQTGDYDGWLKEVVTNDRLDGDSENADFLERSYAQGGFRAVMNAMASTRGYITLPNGHRSRIDPCWAAQADLWLDRKTAALNELDSCSRSAQLDLIYMKVDPAWARLREEPRYQAVLHRMGLN